MCISPNSICCVTSRHDTYRACCASCLRFIQRLVNSRIPPPLSRILRQIRTVKLERLSLRSSLHVSTPTKTRRLDKVNCRRCYWHTLGRHGGTKKILAFFPGRYMHKCGIICKIAEEANLQFCHFVFRLHHL